ncbi:hypothetical protein NPIL_129751, partial [Nephila pilipes]
NGLHFDYSEDVFIDYRKQLDRSWRPSEGLFVESNGRKITIPGPRSLQHLCRCSLRQRLADNHQLPEGTQNLGLPKILKEHIDLET